MKFSHIAASVLAVTLGMSSVAYAKNDPVYYPPERISCSLKADGQLTCGDFERNYLIEGTHTADFNQDQEQTFTFTSATAYTGYEVKVIFGYVNAKNKKVVLETFDTSIQPDLASGSWKPLNNNHDIYTCNEGYKNCGITNLPSR